MANRQDTFIQSLTDDLPTKGRLRSPLIRSSLCFLFIGIGVAFVTPLIQEFRPGSMIQFKDYARFQIEIISGLLLCFTMTYTLFKKIIPGRKLSALEIAAQLLAAAFFFGSLFASFKMEAPLASPLGARSVCDLEIILYGGVALVGMFFALRKGMIQNLGIGTLSYGFAAGLLPALTMQFACMYDPWHAVLFHFAPVGILSLGGVILLKAFLFLERKFNI